MDTKEIEASVRSILLTKSYGNKMPADFPHHDSLFMHGIVDSFGLFAFVHALQEHFSLRIIDREIHPGNFETIDKIVHFIASKQ